MSAAPPPDDDRPGPLPAPVPPPAGGRPPGGSPGPVPPPGSGGTAPDVRISDREREAVVAALSSHTGAGRLTLAELEDRLTLVYGATTRAELDRVTADLPTPDSPPDAALPRRAPTRWLVTLLAGGSKRGRWRMGSRVRAVCLLGGADIDLRHATLDTDEATITVVCILGGVDIYVPDTVDAEVGGFSLLGGTDERGSTGPPRVQGPSVRVRAYNLLGGTDVWRLPPEADDLSLRDARKLASGRRRLR